MAARLFAPIRLAVLFCVGLGAVGAAQTPPPPVGMRIAPRDVLTISTMSSGQAEPSLSGKFQVGLDGNIEFPNLGRVKAADLTTREVEADIKKALGEKYLRNPQVTVELEQTSSKHFNILGEVRSPGAYPFSGSITIFDALARAGSTTDAAADVALLRRGTSVAGATASEDTLVDLHELLSGGSRKDNITLEDGDTLIVQKVEPVFVSGEVKSPGAFPMPRGTTVYQAVTLAGGVSVRGKWSGIKIQRKEAGKKDPLIIQVKDPKTEVVKPGDTIIVPARIM